MKYFSSFIAVILPILLEKAIASATVNGTTDAPKNLRDMFRKKFMSNYSRNDTKHSDPDVSTIIKHTSIVGGEEVLMVTEEALNIFKKKEEESWAKKENWLNENHTLSDSQESWNDTSVSHATNNSNVVIKQIECECVCPKLEANLCNERGTIASKITSDDHHIRELKIFKNNPDFVLKDSVDMDTLTTNQRFSNNLGPGSYESSRYRQNYRSVDEEIGSCAKIMASSHGKTENGIYNISIFGFGPTKVYCYRDPADTSTTSCAWTLFMRREKIGDLFDKSWQEYQNGFGNLNGSFFLGLDRIYALTIDGPQELGILTHFATKDVEEEKYAEFQIGDESTDYKVEVLGKFSQSSVVRRLSLDSKFSTMDKDSGDGLDKCAQFFDMGWWYSQRCKAAAKLSGVRAYLNARVVMGLRPTECKTNMPRK